MKATGADYVKRPDIRTGCAHPSPVLEKIKATATNGKAAVFPLEQLHSIRSYYGKFKGFKLHVSEDKKNSRTLAWIEKVTS